jgi:hypothetical protein
MSDIFGMRPENRNDVATPTTTTATTYNPFDAIGVQAERMTPAQINQHFRRAALHLRQATAMPVFPTQQEINGARDYLTTAAATPQGMTRAVSNWLGHRQTFFAALPYGDPNVFTATAATATAGPAGIPVSASSAAPAPPATPHNPRFRPDARPQPQPSASASATPGSSRANPVALDSDDDEYDEDEELGAAATATPGMPTPARAPANRSTGRSARAVPAINIDNTMEIVVGTWRNSTATPCNAVIARFDSRGRLNFRIVARSYNGVPVPGPNATATAASSIIFMGQYAGMSYAQVRARLIQQLSQQRRLM